MRLRKMTADGDYQFGHGLADFWRDQVEGVGQAIKTRLLLYRGEWFLDTTSGTPWGGFPFNDAVIAQAQVLGAHTQDTRDLAIKERIIGTQGVSGLIDYSSDIDPTTRMFRIGAVVDTIYGAAVVATEGTELVVFAVDATTVNNMRRRRQRVISDARR